MGIVSRIVWIIVIAICIAGAAIGGLYVRYLITSNNFSNYWSQKMLDEGELVYVALGDSTAVGVGASNPQSSYVGIVAQNIQATTGKSVKIVNLALPGKHIKDVIKDQVPKLSEYHPDIVTVSVGANDVNSGEDTDMINYDMDSLMQMLPSQTYFAEIPSFTDSQKNAKIQKINQHINSSTDETGIIIVPIYNATNRVKNDFSYLDFDLFHPNDKGYRIWADTFLDAIK
jgi:lysophospholipase L1-like esterase